MREKSEYAGRIIKTKTNVGNGLQCGDMSGAEFIIEDWCENVLRCSWMNANGNPVALEYAIRTAMHGDNNNVPMLSEDVLYGKIGGFAHLFHMNELKLN